MDRWTRYLLSSVAVVCMNAIVPPDSCAQLMHRHRNRAKNLNHDRGFRGGFVQCMSLSLCERAGRNRRQFVCVRDDD